MRATKVNSTIQDNAEIRIRKNRSRIGFKRAMRSYLPNYSLLQILAKAEAVNIK